MERRKQKIFVRKKHRFQRKEKVRWVISRLLLLIIFLGSIAFFGKKFYNYFIDLPFLRINHIEIKNGDENLTKKLESFLEKKIGSHIFFSQTKLKKQIFALFPELKEIKIKYQLGGKVFFFLTKREPLAQIFESESPTEIRGIDIEGKIFLLSTAGELPKIPAEEKNLGKVVNFLYWLKNNRLPLFMKVERISTLENSDLVLTLDSGDKIIWGDTEPKEEKMSYLQAVFNNLAEKNKKINSVDLRFFPEGGIIVRLAH